MRLSKISNMHSMQKPMLQTNTIHCIISVRPFLFDLELLILNLTFDLLPHQKQDIISTKCCKNLMLKCIHHAYWSVPFKSASSIHIANAFHRMLFINKIMVLWLIFYLRKVISNKKQSPQNTNNTGHFYVKIVSRILDGR